MCVCVITKEGLAEGEVRRNANASNAAATTGQQSAADTIRPLTCDMSEVLQEETGHCTSSVCDHPSGVKIPSGP